VEALDQSTHCVPLVELLLYFLGLVASSETMPDELPGYIDLLRDPSPALDDHVQSLGVDVRDNCLKNAVPEDHHNVGRCRKKNACDDERKDCILVRHIQDADDVGEENWDCKGYALQPASQGSVGAEEEEEVHMNDTNPEHSGRGHLEVVEEQQQLEVVAFLQVVCAGTLMMPFDQAPPLSS
jgi:hypothetical protein